MSQDIAGEKQQPLYPPSDATSLPPEPPATLSLDARIIEVAKQKKKIKVIEIEDSQQEEAKPVKPLRIKQKRLLPHPVKPKKTIIRCMLCKEPGKKAAMKACLDCKIFTHISCLQQEGEQLTRYLCRKCRHKREENVLAKKAEKGGERIGEEKLTVRRLQKEKRREEQQKKLGQFLERYPYYLQEDRVRFPIEDKLLFIYRELFDVNETPRPKPVSHPLIPPLQLADLLQIQNFFSTFRQELVGFGTLPSEIKKDIFYLSLGSNGYDGVYCCLIQCLLNVYLSDIFDKNKTDNVRILNDHPFFTLMIHLNDNQEITQQILVRSTKQIMRYLSTIPSMKKSFDGLQFPKRIDTQQKINLIVGLIKGMSQIDEFHDLVSIKSQKMQQLTKEKTELVAQLKVDQAESLSNNEKLKDMNQVSKDLENTQEGVTRQLTKQLDKHKKKIQRLANMQTKSQESIKEIRNKIAEIGRAMPFLTSEVYFLGCDKNESEYFFYMRQPNRVYVKLRSYLMDKNQHFYLYQSKQTITQLMKSLNTKGIKERHLFQNIQFLIKDEIITNNIVIDQSSNLMLEEQKFKDVTFDDILNMIRQTEETFSTYLSVKQYQWTSPAVRQLFMDQLMVITDLQTLKENLRSLQESFLFAEYANADTPRKRQDESDEQLRGEARQGRKKVPIRIWGINSQKTKKYWVEYLQQCIDEIGIWICAYIFKNNVDKYVKKKMEAYYQMQLKQQKYRARENGHGQRGRPPLRRKIQQNNKYEKKPKVVESSSSSSSSSPPQESEQVIECRRPNLRIRKHKKMNIDSQYDNEPEEQEGEEDSSNEDCCEICGEYGDMICCDTCPKVYHADCLKIKDVPDGEWSCFKCLQKMSNERQTRSRMKKMSKFV